MTYTEVVWSEAISEDYEEGQPRRGDVYATNRELPREEAVLQVEEVVEAAQGRSQ